MRNIALILLYDDQKRFLLQLRTADAPTYPNCYGFFGGGIEEGEDSLTAVKRECFEELEYELEDPLLLLNTVETGDYGKLNIYLYLEKYNSEKKLILHEGQAMKWTTKEESKKINLSNVLINILAEAYKKI